MSDVIISQRWLARGGTAADLATVNETPKARELILETDTGRLKRGDGATTYNDLPYINTGKIDFSGIADGKVPMWSASNSRFDLKSITADAVEYTAGSSSSLEADNVAEALDELSAKVGEKIGDAPSDGNTYGRKDGNWAQVTGGGAAGPGAQVGYARTESSSPATTTSSIPLDNSIPQSSEGAAYPSLDTTITPTSATSLLVVEVDIPLVSASTTTNLVFALFRDSESDAISATFTAIEASDRGRQLRIRVVVAAGSTAETTFKLRWGTSSGTGALLRTNGTAAFLGGVVIATMSVAEIKQ